MNVTTQTITIESHAQLLLLIACLGPKFLTRYNKVKELIKQAQVREAFDQDPTETAESFYGEPIHTYTRRQAIEDGLQFDANSGPLAEVTRQHTRAAVYMTRGVWSLLDTIDHNKRTSTDIRGTWHDILSMMGYFARGSRGDNFLFQVKIVGAGRQKMYTLRAEIGPVDIDDPRPAITISLQDED